MATHTMRLRGLYVSKFLAIRNTCFHVALLGLLLQGSSAGHMFFVEHGRCAEHGELVHGQPSHAHAKPAHHETSEVAIQSTPGTSSEEAHDHCLLASDRRDAAARVSHARIGAAPLAHAPDRFARNQLGPRDESTRFRVAPKNSPPA